MRLLLDTDIFLWFVSGDMKLAPALREAIRNPQNEIFLSVVSLWEIVIKHQLGHLPLPQAAELYVPTQRKRLCIESLAVDEESIFQVAKLPRLHRDPFDRLLIGQAIEHDLKLVTADTAIRAYPMAPIL
jgi:PIN domain nuclease of toxin-antitoxin system